MDAGNLTRSLDAVAASGFVLSTAQRAALQASLCALRASQQFAAVQLWGRVQGTSRDYLVAVGLGATPAARKLYYSTDGAAWAQLPEVHPVIAASCLKLRTRFTGDASAECAVVEPKPDAPVSLPADAERLRSEADGQITTRVTEEMRLAAAVAAASADCLLVPRGAFRKAPEGGLQPCRLFGGLSTDDGTVLSNYLKLLQPLSSPRVSARVFEQTKKK
mgnify:CR=1 FL=1